MRTTVQVVLIALLALGAAVAARWRAVSDRDAEDRVSQAITGLDAIRREIRIRAATGGATLNGHGWPETIDPAWFADDLPVNPYVSSDHPWLEIAGEHEANLAHPQIRQAVRKEYAGFWYNQFTGIIRARVGPQVTDLQAIEIYNRINASAINDLFSPSSGLPMHLQASGSETQTR